MSKTGFELVLEAHDFMLRINVIRIRCMSLIVTFQIDVVETAVEALHKIKKALNHHGNLGFICLLPNTFPYQGFLFVCNTLHTLSRIHTHTCKNHYVNRYRPNSTATLYVEAPFERPEVGYL